MSNQIDMHESYWRGVLDTCQYLFDELGFEDAMDCNMAEWAKEELGV